MRILQLFIEMIFIGSLTIFAFSHLLSLPALSLDAIEQHNINGTFVFIVLAWIIGLFINLFSAIFLNPVSRQVEARWMQREGNPELLLERLHYELYVRATNKEIIQRVEYHRSLIRLSRCVLFVVISYFILAALLKDYHQSILSLMVLLGSFFAFYRTQIGAIKSTYYAWSAINQNNSLKSSISSENDGPVNKVPERGKKSAAESIETLSGIHIVAFTGGTGFRDINMSLALKTQNITRVVPIWDNGGSSKVLRQSFDIMPVGDIRHALMTQAHGEGRVGTIVKLFNWRLSDTGDKKKLVSELESFIDNQHPLMKSLDPCLGNVIVNYLKRFHESLPVFEETNELMNTIKAMNLKHGSIGNFVLVGSYLAHHKDINTAIYVFRQLCSIDGNVWPISVANDLHINACLEDGQRVTGQSKITTIDRSKSHQRIKKISFSQYPNSQDLDLQEKELPEKGPHKKELQEKTQSVSVQANPMVLDALKKTDVIVFGPGSFFTSILPHLMIDGVADTISRLDVTKIFIGNLLEDSECFGYTLEEIIDVFLATCNQYATVKRPANKYITHIIAHSSHTMTEYTHNDRHYLYPGENISRFNKSGISLIINDFENPWKRGGHDPNCIADYLINIGQSKIHSQQEIK
jgi:CofD-related protein of GAK system